MAAIDLLFDTKLDSERLHQLALGPILTRSGLVAKLGIVGAPSSDDWEWEPRRGLFDLAIALSDPEQPSADSTRRVWIELKIDSDLDSNQWDRQLDFLDGKPDHILYLLLGTAAHSGGDWREGEIRDRRAADGALGLVHRAVDLEKYLRELAHDHGTDERDRDIRDLMVAYRTALARLRERVEKFEQRPLEEWQHTDYVGFFAKLLKRNSSMQGQTWIGKVNTPQGGFMAAAWGWKKRLGIEGLDEVYLQWEGDFNRAADLKLCFKINAQERANRSRLRDEMHQLIVSAADKLDTAARKPTHFGTGKTMTVAVLDGRPLAGSEDWNERWARVQKAVCQAEKVIKCV